MVEVAWAVMPCRKGHLSYLFQMPQDGEFTFKQNGRSSKQKPDAPQWNDKVEKFKPEKIKKQEFKYKKKV